MRRCAAEPGVDDLTFTREVLSVSRLLDRDVFLERAVSAIRALVDPPAVFSVTLEPSGEVACSVAGDVDAESFGRSRLRSRLTDLLASSDPLPVEPIGEDELSGIHAGSASMQGGIVIPLQSGRGRIGAIVALFASRVGERTLATASKFAEALDPAVANLLRLEELADLVIRDDTTLCFNRRFLDRGLVEEAERSRRFGKPFAVIFLDMDDLKLVNTRHGHSAGSRVLREAARRISDSVRGIDRVHRYGGDEFVVVLPGTDKEGAREVAERIHDTLASSAFDLGDGHRVSLGASSGFAVWPEHGPTGHATMMAADAAMRRIKASRKGGIGAAALSGAPRSES